MSSSSSSFATVPLEIRGSGPILLLVPGGLTGWRGWQPHVESLSAGRTVIRSQLLSVELGLRGEPLPDDYSLRTESRALARTLEEVATEPIDVAGWSYGGAVALDLALERPERIRSLTLIEPPCFWVLRELGRLEPEALAAQQEHAAYGPGEISAAQLRRFLVDAGIVPEGVDAAELPQWPQWLEHRQSLRIGDAPERHEDDIERLRGFARPTLLFKGTGSTSFLHGIVDALDSELPDARVEELPGAHALHLVSRERFLEIFEEFLSSRG